MSDTAQVERRSPPAGGPPAPGAPPRAGEPAGGGNRGARWWTLRILIGGLGLFALIQAVPYGRAHSNPPTTAEPRWDSQATRALAQRACFDCHSNLSVWPWYSNVAPVSWLVQRDVDGGRSALNFSEWNRPQDSAGDAIEAVSSGSMPPWFYAIMHPKANLSKADQQALAQGLAATFRNSPPLGGGGG